MSKKFNTNIQNDGAYITNTIVVNDLTPTQIVLERVTSPRLALRLQVQGEVDILVRISPNSDMSDYMLFKTGETFCDDFYQGSYYAQVDSANPATIITWETFRKFRS